jgi:diadenosine tetraphosphate (Ap4A) HIT family hydrolase
MSVVICPFCVEIKHNSLEISNSNRIIFESDHFYLVPTLGCFIEGYCLFVPKRHVYSFCQLNYSESEELFKNFRMIKSTIETKFNKDVIIFEHGAKSSALNLHSCIDHAHLHIVPGVNKLLVLKYFIDICGKPVIVSSKIQEKYFEREDYLYLNYEDKHLYWTELSKVPKQFGRIVCADILGIKQFYNWRIYPFKEKMMDTKSTLKNEFVELSYG